MNQHTNKAEKENPALKVFEILVGEWDTTGTHPYMPDTIVHGKAKFEWIEGGAFLRTQQHIDDERFPDGVAHFGSDNVAGTYFMIYFDERDISRKYDVLVEGNIIKYERIDAEFSQRMTLTISDDGKTIVSVGEMRKKDGEWEGDLNLTYMRA